MSEISVGVLGAKSLVGHYVIDLLVSHGYRAAAFSRYPVVNLYRPGVSWHWLKEVDRDGAIARRDYWICLCPVWAVAEHFDLLRKAGAKRVVVLSSTSLFTKTVEAGSRDKGENALAERLAQGEKALREWAQKNEIEWVILRSTLIYDLMRDKNLKHIAKFIRRFGFFPLFGKAQGLRQPVHASDVAGAALAAMLSPNVANEDYNIAGSETMTYRQMVERIFELLDRKPRFVQVPLTGFAIAIYLAKIFPRYRHLSTAMAQRMSQDLAFDFYKATNDFGYAPSALLSNRNIVL